MSEERVIELCKLAGIKEYAPWLIGVHAEHLRNREARMTLEKLAKQLGAAAALAVAALLPVGSARAMTQAEPFADLCIMRSRLDADIMATAASYAALTGLSKTVSFCGESLGHHNFSVSSGSSQLLLLLGSADCSV